RRQRQFVSGCALRHEEWSISNSLNGPSRQVNFHLLFDPPKEPFMMSCIAKWADEAGAVSCHARAASGLDWNASRSTCRDGRTRPARPRADLALLVSQLPDRYRLPLILRYLDGLEVARVAAILGRNVETTRLELNRAVNALREALSASRRPEAGLPV